MKVWLQFSIPVQYLFTCILKGTSSFNYMLLSFVEGKSNVCLQGGKLREIRKTEFHNAENETAIDRNGDIRSFFPWSPCKRLLEFRTEWLVVVDLQMLID